MDSDDVEDITNVGATAQPLLDGAYDDFLRPEIGLLDLLGSDCTGTLVHPSFVLTAAHCVDYVSGPVAGTFKITAPGNNIITSIDRAYSLGNIAGATDIALVHLVSPISPTDARPAGWTSIAFAFSNSSGGFADFTAGNLPMVDFPYLSTLSYFALPGRFKAHSPGGDGKRGIALLGSPGWTTIPTAFLRD